jgi:hypothetical protein
MFVSITKDSFIAAERVHSIIPQDFIQFRRMKKMFQGDDVLSEGERRERADASSQEEKLDEEFVKGSTSLIDITYGKSVETIIFMDSGHLILTCVEAKKIIDKVKKSRRGEA